MNDSNSIVRATDSSRRRFLKSALIGSGAVLAVGPAGAAGPTERNGSTHMKLSLAAYSFHRLLPRSWTAETIADAKMTLEDFIDFCAEQNLDGTELTSYYFPQDVTNEYLMGLKERTFRLGLDISGTAIGNDFCVPPGPLRDRQLMLMKAWIDHAATMGAPVIRIFAGRVPRGENEDAAIARCAEAINESLEYAATKGVFLALENHGGITSNPETMLKIVAQVSDSPWFGINFDSGNFRTDDPYGDLEKIAPYTINAQIKISVSPGGEKEPADFARLIGILDRAHYRGYVVLEYEGAEEPRQAIPGYLATLRELIS